MDEELQKCTACGKLKPINEWCDCPVAQDAKRMWEEADNPIMPEVVQAVRRFAKDKNIEWAFDWDTMPKG